MYLQGKNFFIYSKECSHSLGPRAQASNITANTLGLFKIEVFHLEVGLHEINCLVSYSVLRGEEQEGLENISTFCVNVQENVLFSVSLWSTRWEV